MARTGTAASISSASVLFAFSLFLHSAAAGTTCAARQLDWYTDVVGENPCETYQRLRRLCNPSYQVPSIDSTPPGNVCDDPNPVCCCNTVAFQLSMLCLNCQHDAVDGYTVGVDAPIGTYEKYLDGCLPHKKNELPPDLQAQACKSGIRLDNLLYNSWDDGAWFYVWTKDNSVLQHGKNNNTFTHCPNQVQPSQSSVISTVGVASTDATASTAPSQAIDGTPTASENLATSKSKATPGTIAGTIIGVLIILGLAAFAFWFLRRERRREARRVSRFQAWRRNASPQMVSTAPAVRYQPIPPSPANTLPNPYTIRTESRLQFHPEAMVRGADNGPPPPPKELHIPGRRPARSRSFGARSDDGSDSRVGEPIDDSPDPTMPLQPLRLEEKKGLT